MGRWNGHLRKLHRYHPGHEPAARRPPSGAGRAARRRGPAAVGPRVALYVCGITPYDAAHAGHAFTYVAFDTLARFLRARGHEVAYCQNVTDVDDDVLRRAARDGEDYLELGRRETAAYLRDMDALNVARPSFLPKATEEIPAMVELAGQLVSGGNAYVVDGTVFFDVTTFPGFGSCPGCARPPSASCWPSGAATPTTRASATRWTSWSGSAASRGSRGGTAPGAMAAPAGTWSARP